MRVGDVIAGIVTFNPDLDRLRSNLAAITPQVAEVIVFDNGSWDRDGIVSLVEATDRVSLNAVDENRGIAHALNSLAEEARGRGYAWLLTLDQDSVSTEHMVEILSLHRAPNIGLVVPFIRDINKSEPVGGRMDEDSAVTRYRRAASKGAITSGALTNLRAVSEIGGFDERLFIDYVDYDLNQRLMLRGFVLLRDDRAVLDHEVGRARRTWLRTPRRQMDGRWTWERFYSFGHSSSRCYYKARNRVIFTKKHWRSTWFRNEGILQIPQQMVLTLLFEEDKYRKLVAFCRGIRDGIRAEV